MCDHVCGLDKLSQFVYECVPRFGITPGVGLWFLQNPSRFRCMCDVAIVCVEQYSCEDTSTEKNQYSEGCNHFNIDPNFGPSYYPSGSVSSFDVLSLAHSAVAMTWCRRNHECSEPLAKDVLVSSSYSYLCTQSYFRFFCPRLNTCNVLSADRCLLHLRWWQRKWRWEECACLRRIHSYCTYSVWTELFRGAAVEQCRVFNWPESLST